MKIDENAYIANAWSRDALVGWHPKTFCDRDKFVARGLQSLNSVRYDLVATKTKRFRGCILSSKLSFDLRSSFCYKK